MSRTVQSAPNTLTVYTDDGTAALGTLLVSALGFIAFDGSGKRLGAFSSDSARQRCVSEER